ncbi:Crossover junction endodeoxyribonuclease RuvC [Caulifigura coniformis]|uniref:Crossover junction endodeoxyribonuclease RuvC n=2 Tax=Caulifigura coniformis TaxID=2527983 RepID=A0A517SMU4_9PLAN|nr:crossover junction endodeoxyribonuclease RuvC [Caulifigura coniformis]QDT57435.1 Crossover junction endodeoxyribonuclease RuvC [Caulifigura coniformis]
MPSMSFVLGNTFAGPAVSVSLGIDPGLNRTGYAVIVRTARGLRLKEGGVLRSTKGLSLAERVKELGSELRNVIEEFRPDGMAVEQLFSHSAHVKTAILMAHARGALLYAAADAGIPVVNYTPTQVKRLLTGSGRASKEQMQLAITRELGLSAVPEPNDVADACAIALCQLHSRQVDLATA